MISTIDREKVLAAIALLQVTEGDRDLLAKVVTSLLPSDSQVNLEEFVLKIRTTDVMLTYLAEILESIRNLGNILYPDDPQAAEDEIYEDYPDEDVTIEIQT